MQVCSESDFPSIPKVHFNILISEDDDIYLGKSVEINKPQHDKTNKMSVCPVKTQISLGIRPVWSESSLSAWRQLGS